MALSERVKTALDETRTLILGAQVLLGFQFRGAFQDRFETVPQHARTMDACALGLMLLTVGLLIAPSAFHRITDRGENNGRSIERIGRFARAALLPFAAGLGLDLAIAGERILESAWAGTAIGIGFALLALVGWYGAGEMIKKRTGAPERRRAEAERDAHEAGPLHSRIEQMLTEARVILPGAQALLGFQLAIVLTSAFEKLPWMTRLVHGFSLLCVALTVILLIAPAALHRIVWYGEDSEEMLRSGGRLITAALVPLGLGIAGDTYVVFVRMTESSGFGAIVAIGTALTLFGIWFAWPIAARFRKSTTSSGARSVGARRIS